MFPSSLPSQPAVRLAVLVHDGFTGANVPPGGLLPPANRRTCLPGSGGWWRGAVTPIARAAPAAPGCLTNRPEPGPVAGGSQIFVPGRGARGLPEALAGNEPPSAGLDVAGQGAASHLVIQEVTGQAGQAGGLIDAVRQPFGRWIWSWRAGHPPAGIWWFRVAAVTWVVCDPPAIMHWG